MKQIFTFLGMSLVLLAYGQQEPQFTQYWSSFSLYNPAATAINDKFYAAIIGRDQWVGVDGAPRTGAAIYEMKINPLNSGIGINYVYDNIGPFTTNDVRINYDYQFNLKNNRTLSIGISAGIWNSKLDFSKLNPLESGDPVLTSQGTQSSVTMEGGLGAIYQVKDKWYVGLSTSQIGESTEELGNATVQLVRHYYLTGGYHISFNNSGLPGFELIPSTLIKSDGTTTQVDLNLLALLNKRYWVGVTYRYSDAVALMVGVDIKGKFRIGYSYDLTTSALGSSGGSNGSHEVVLAMMLK